MFISFSCVRRVQFLPFRRCAVSAVYPWNYRTRPWRLRRKAKKKKKKKKPKTNTGLIACTDHNGSRSRWILGRDKTRRFTLYNRRCIPTCDLRGERWENSTFVLRVHYFEYFLKLYIILTTYLCTYRNYRRLIIIYTSKYHSCKRTWYTDASVKRGITHKYNIVYETI